MAKNCLVAVVVALLIGCGSAADQTPTPVTIQTEGLTPTVTPVARPTPTRAPTPIPPTPDLELIINERVAEQVAEILAGMETPTPVPTEPPTPIPDTPTPAPTNTPEPLVRPVPAPKGSAVANVLRIGSISLNNRILRISGTIQGRGHDPSSIQVWNAYDPEPYSETCSTERPIAFIQPGNGSVVYTGQTSPYQWTFCRNGIASSSQTDDVPWLYSQNWTYSLRDRRHIHDPYIYDFSVSANLSHERVERLEYDAGVASGWRVIIWSGERMIANQWLDY